MILVAGEGRNGCCSYSPGIVVSGRTSPGIVVAGMVATAFLPYLTWLGGGSSFPTRIFCSNGRKGRHWWNCLAVNPKSVQQKQTNKYNSDEHLYTNKQTCVWKTMIICINDTVVYNHPSDTNYHSSSAMAAVSSSPAFTQPKVVEKIFSLPIVSDSYSYGKIVKINISCS